MADRFYESPAAHEGARSAPAALRNREPIADVLSGWLPQSGLVLEVASGTGEHVTYFAERFPALEWQPSDIHPLSLQSIAAWLRQANLPNVRQPIAIDSSARDWPIDHADAVVNINMVHISPWETALGLLAGAARLLPEGGPLILYGPWLCDGIETEPSNLSFDADLRLRNPRWGLRRIEEFAGEAERYGFELCETRRMPANNMMLLFRWQGAVSSAG